MHSADGILALGGAIVTVALVTTIVSHPQSAGVLTAFGNAFSNALRAAQGQPG
jgi:hypothetical protein